MPQSKILLDSNSYFRLAKSLHPLLDVVFGNDNYCLYVLRELDREYDKSPVLRRKFNWVNDDEYFENRKKRLSISRAELIWLLTTCLITKSPITWVYPELTSSVWLRDTFRMSRS